MNKPVLVVMAAGMGSRYGGMKQIDPVGPNGEVIIDYSLTTHIAPDFGLSFLSSSMKSRKHSVLQLAIAFPKSWM